MTGTIFSDGLLLEIHEKEKTVDASTLGTKD
jgi:hypothetical protein